MPSNVPTQNDIYLMNDGTKIGNISVGHMFKSCKALNEIRINSEEFKLALAGSIYKGMADKHIASYTVDEYIGIIDGRAPYTIDSIFGHTRLTRNGVNKPCFAQYMAYRIRNIQDLKNLGIYVDERLDTSICVSFNSMVRSEGHIVYAIKERSLLSDIVKDSLRQLSTKIDMCVAHE